MAKPKYDLQTHGFEEVSFEAGMMNVQEYTGGCSGGRSDCCTRTCSLDENFAESEKGWEDFLKVEGGQVQY